MACCGGSSRGEGPPSLFRHSLSASLLFLSSFFLRYFCGGDEVEGADDIVFF